VSGIWPPDIGGPASHGPDVGRFLASRGHRVWAVTSASDGRPELCGFPVRAVRRDRPRPLRLASGLALAAAAARDADVVYAAGMYTRSAIAASLNSVPLVVKLVNDPAYERARRFGLFSGTIEEFQRERGDARIRALRTARNFALRRAARIVIPGRYLERLGVGWGLPPERFKVIPNAVPPVDQTIPRDELRRRFSMNGPNFVFAGRFVGAKNVPLAVRALRRAPGVSLVLVGEGDDIGAIERAIAESGVAERIAMHPALPRKDAIQWVRAADAAILPSDWEVFPHAALEALSVGTPVIATAVGGVPEIVNSGVNGLLVPPGDEEALGAAMASLAGDADLRGRLRRGAAATGDRYAPERAFAAIEAQLQRAVELSGGRRRTRAVAVDDA
jgi:glycosyltransferase involved in cell wall biosynthesis